MRSSEQLLDLWLKDYDEFCAKTRDTRKVEKIRDVIRKPYIHSWDSSILK
jgi:hypothetical protein